MTETAAEPTAPGDRWTYFMDHADEAERLAAKVDAPGWVERELGGQALGERSPQHLLDVGCGPGALAHAASHAHPHAHVTGLDLSRERLLYGADRGWSFVQARAETLPFADGSFDAVWCRFLLQYLPDKDAAVREMNRVLRPGGTLLLQDLDGQLVWQHPMPIELRSELDVVLDHLARGGFDPQVGRKLFSMCLGAGFVDPTVRIEPYHQLAGRPEERTRTEWQTKLRIAASAIRAAFGGDEARADAFGTAFERNLFDPDTLVYSVLFTVRVKKPR
ncbi:MAG: methyltransferase domain-containing protein [Planctomycetota bacterium]